MRLAYEANDVKCIKLDIEDHEKLDIPVVFPMNIRFSSFLICFPNRIWRAVESSKGVRRRTSPKHTEDMKNKSSFHVLLGFVSSAFGTDAFVGGARGGSEIVGFRCNVRIKHRPHRQRGILQHRK